MLNLFLSDYIDIKPELLLAAKYLRLLTLFPPNDTSPLLFKLSYSKASKEEEEKFLILFPAKLSIVRVLLKLVPNTKLYKSLPCKSNVIRAGKVFPAKAVKSLSDKSRELSFWKLFPVKLTILFDSASSNYNWGKLASLIS